jgi:hypothetical protein
MASKSSMGCGTLTLVSLLALVGYCLFVPSSSDRYDTPLFQSSERPTQRSSPKSKRPPDFDAIPEMQADREEFIRKLIQDGYWEKTEFSGSLPKVWVTHKFMLSDEKSQNETLSVVYAYWMGELDSFGGSGFFWDPLVLKIDNGTPNGRRVATYTPEAGIKPE